MKKSTNKRLNGFLISALILAVSTPTLYIILGQINQSVCPRTEYGTCELEYSLYIVNVVGYSLIAVSLLVFVLFATGIYKLLKTLNRGRK